MKSTIGRRIGFAFLVIIILMGAMVGITFHGFNKITSSLDNMEREAVKRGASGNLRFGIAQLLMAGNDYIITENEYYQREYDRLSSRADDFCKQFLHLPLTEEEQQLLAGIKQDLDSIRAYSAQIFAIPNSRQSPKAWALMETIDYRFGYDVNQKTTEIFDGISRRIQQHRLQAAANKTNALNSIYGITFLGILISLVVSYLTVQRIAKPIVTVTKAANGIANGDYSQRPVVKTHDEVAVLAQSFSRMAESIQQSQRSLEESKRLTESIVATVSSGLLVFGSDGKILSVNNSFCDIFGLPHSLLTDQNIGSVFEELGISEECCSRILARQPFRDIECTYSDPTRGTRIFSMTLFPIRLANGESLLVIDDITKRKLTEQIILDNEKRFRSLIENSSDGLSVIDADGKPLYTSPVNSRLLGYPYDELTLKNAFSFIHPDDLPLIVNVFRKLLEQPSAITMEEMRVQHKDGTWRVVEATAKNFLHDSTIGGVVVNFRDITERKLAEEEMQRISTAIEQIADCVIITDKHGIIQYVNLAFTKASGYSKEEALGKNPSIVKSGLQPPQFFESLWRTILSGQVFRATFINKRKDGELFYEVKTITPIRNKEGNITHFVSTAEEITEQKLAEEALQQSEQRYTELFETTNDLIQAISPDEKFLYVNRAWRETLGYSEEEISRLSMDEVIHSNSREQCQATLQRVMAGEKIERIETVFVSKDGTPVIVEGGMFCKYEAGRPVSIACILRDVTEQKRSDEALRGSEKKYREFFDQNLAATFISSPEGILIDCNQAFAQTFGFTSVEEAKSTPVETLYKSAEYRQTILRKLLSEKKLENFEIELVRKDGKTIYAVANIVARFDEHDKMTQTIGYLIDQTEYRSLQRQFIQSQKLESLGTLASGIAHDFNNILGIIIGHASLLEALPTDPQVIKKHTDAITKSGMRGAAIVKQLLTFARKTEVLIETVLLNDIVHEVSKLLGETFPKAITISLHLDKGLPFIVADSTQLHQVLLNLCVNARDAMPNGGTLTITTQRQPGEMIRTRFSKATAHEYIRLSVADTGMGMDEATRIRIFEPFFTTKGRGKGTGLGLSLVFGITETHKGVIDVESELGKGTAFHLFFPVIQSTAETAQPNEQPAQLIAGGSETILLVEDEEMLRELVKVILEAEGYTVLTAGDGEEAIAVFQQQQNEIQLVMSDLDLPKFSGDELCRKLKVMNPRLPMILTSGYVEPEMKAQVLREGVKEFVQKPYNPNELLRAIRRVLDKG